MGAIALLAVGALFAAVRVWAHESGSADAAASQAASSTPWNFEAWLIGCLLLAAWLYACGVTRLWRRAGAGRGILVRQVCAFAAGWVTLVIALVSPLDGLGSQLFSAHMVQHELLMVVAAPLLVIGRPLAAWTWGLPSDWRAVVGRASRWPWLTWLWRGISQPLNAWALHALAVWLWHIPQLFDAALRAESWHVVQHASFLGTALLFWWAVLGGAPRVHGRGFGLAYLFTTMMHTAALGALLSLAPTPWYAGYAASTIALGLDPLQDQQLGGLVMWVPGGIAYLLAGLVLVARLLAQPALNPASADRPGQTH